MSQQGRRHQPLFSEEGIVIGPLMTHYGDVVVRHEAVEVLVAPHGQRELCAIGLLHDTHRALGRHGPQRDCAEQQEKEI